jgi:hypothetical protein
MPIESWDRRELLLKAEVTEGTDSVPVAATNALQILNGRSGFTSQKITRQNDRAYFGNRKFAQSQFRGFVEGEIELVGAATEGTAAPIAPLILICGFAETLVTSGPPDYARYSPISAAIPSASAYFVHDTVFRSLLGCRGNLSSIAFAIDDFPKASFRIEGTADPDEVAEDTLPGGTYTAFQDVSGITADTSIMTINGETIEGISMIADLSNRMGAAHSTEWLRNRIRGREPTVTMRYHRPALADFNPWAVWKAGTLVPAVFTHTDPVSGHYAKLTVQVQLEEPTEQDLEGDKIIEQVGRCVPSGSGGNELILEFGVAA